MPYGLSETVIPRLTNIFALHPEVEEALLFGSRAKGNFKEGSDIDITLKGNDVTMNVFRKIELEIDALLLPWVVDLVIYNTISEPLLVDHINRVGICIYKRIKPAGKEQNEANTGKRV